MVRAVFRLCLFLAVFLGSAAQANAWRLGVSVGAIDVSRDHEALEVGVDLGLSARRWGLVPHFGVHATTDESSYGYVGLRRPFEFPRSRFLIEPSFAVSLYDRGEGKELGGPLEFRSGIEVLWQAQRGTRFGLGYYHLSNSSIYDLNPGTNSLLLRIVLPDR